MNMQKNALEMAVLMDTVLIASNAPQLYKSSNYYGSYAELANSAVIPFFNVRNRSAGLAYNNLDSANKLPFAYHLTSIGVGFESPMIAYGGPPTSQTPSDLFWAQEIPKHAALILRVSQDEKLVCSCMALPEGVGLAGFSAGLESQAPTGATRPGAMHNIKVGSIDPRGRYGFKEPLRMPREVTYEVQIILSDYARMCLSRMSGPGDYIHDVSGLVATPAASLIRVTMHGVREVQQRNDLFFQSGGATAAAIDDGVDE